MTDIKSRTEAELTAYCKALGQPAFRAKAVDTTAAGDTFTGYFITGMLRGDSVAQALRSASMASAIAVGRPGAGASIPTRGEVDAALKNS